jgi:hypothetical protein
MKFLLLIFLLFNLTSCIELLDDLTINKDGSGKFKFNVNLSSSKVETNSILALDTIDGHRVPKKEEIDSRIKLFKSKLEKQPGISNVFIETNWDDLLIKFSCDFRSIDELQNGIRSSLDIVDSNDNWLSWDGKCLKRNIPEVLFQSFYSYNYLKYDKLKLGTYTSITRFETEIKKWDNQKSILSKSKKSIMTQIDTETLFRNSTLLNNKISL